MADTNRINSKYTGAITKVDQVSTANIAAINGITWVDAYGVPFNGVLEGVQSFSSSWHHLQQLGDKTFQHNAVDNTKWAVAFWIKKTGLDATRQSVFYSGDTAGTGVGRGACGFTANNEWEWFTDTGATAGWLVTSGRLTDWCGWYHICHIYDSSDATSSDRMKMYINGNRITEFGTANYPALNQAYQQDIGDVWALGNSYSRYFSGIICDLYYTQGHTFAATDVGEFVDNIWVPKDPGTALTGAGTDTTSNYTGWTNNVTHPYETFSASGLDISQAVNSSARGHCYTNAGQAVAVGDVIRVQGTLDIDSVSGDLDIYFLDNTLASVISTPNYNDGRSTYSATGTYELDIWFYMHTADATGAVLTLNIDTGQTIDFNLSGLTLTYYTNSEYKYGQAGNHYFGAFNADETDVAGFLNPELDRGFINGARDTNLLADLTNTNIVYAESWNHDSPENNLMVINKRDAYTTTVQHTYSTVDHSGGRYWGYNTTNWITAATSVRCIAGKWYWEYVPTSDATYAIMGMTTLPDYHTRYWNVGAFYPGDSNGDTNWHCGLYFDGSTAFRLYQAGSYTSTTGYNSALGDTMCCAFDCSNGYIWFGFCDNSDSDTQYWFDSSGGVTGDPAGGTNPTFQLYILSDDAGGQDDTQFQPIIGAYQAFNHKINRIDSEFTGTRPAGFKDFSMQNVALQAGQKIKLTRVDIRNNYCNSVVYTGTGAADNSITLGFQPDLVAIKEHGNTRDWRIYDSERGATYQHYWNNTTAHSADTDSLVSFDATGFTVDGDVAVNGSGQRYSAYGWKASADYGFEVITYAGDGTATRAISHNLGKRPTFMIVRCYDGAAGWYVYHEAALTWTDPETDHGRVDSTNAWADNNLIWGDTAPTSQYFYVNHDGSANFYTNRNGYNYVAYIWTNIPGVQRAVAWEGNGGANGPFMWTDFEPQIIMFKNAQGTNSWRMFDVADDRWPYNNADIQRLLPDGNNNEAGDGADAHLHSNGMSVEVIDAYINTLNDKCVGMAWGHRPFYFSPARMSDEVDRV